MFTGLIQHVGTVKSLAQRSYSATLTADLGPLAEKCKTGDSISINGACLTVSEIKGSLIKFDVSAETLGMSTFCSLKPGAKVNIELALQVGDRLGGHMVQGHIDGTAKIKDIKKQNNFAKITISAAPELIKQMIPKGSVAIDGISLTIASLDKDTFTIVVIPKTLADTTLADAQTGQAVNIEIDIITKTVKRHIETMLGGKEGLTIEKLRQSGF